MRVMDASVPNPSPWIMLGISREYLEICITRRSYYLRHFKHILYAHQFLLVVHCIALYSIDCVYFYLLFENVPFNKEDEIAP